jgi:hypothetical protein
MTTHPFRNDASYEERADQLRNERKSRPADREPTTYSALAGLDLSLEGRFAPGGYVVGSEESVAYPAAASPWSGPQVPQEPSLGVEIDALPPTGEAHEITASQFANAPGVCDHPRPGPLAGPPNAPALIPGSQQAASASAAERDGGPAIPAAAHERLGEIFKVKRRKI